MDEIKAAKLKKKKKRPVRKAAPVKEKKPTNTVQSLLDMRRGDMGYEDDDDDYESSSSSDWDEDE